MDRQRQRQRWREGEREILIKESSHITEAGEPEVCGGGPQAGHSGRHHCCRLESKESLEAEFLPFGESSIPSSERASELTDTQSSRGLMGMRVLGRALMK